MIKKSRMADPSAMRLSERLRTLFRCNREFFHRQSEQELLQSICNILVTGEDLRLAWVGYSESDSEQTIRPVAKAGCGLDFLAQARISCGDSARRQDPAGIAVLTGKAYRINDIRADAKEAPWRSAAIAQGFASCIALPLVAQHKQLRALDLRGALESLCGAPRGVRRRVDRILCRIGGVPHTGRDDAPWRSGGRLVYDVTALPCRRGAQARRRRVAVGTGRTGPRHADDRDGPNGGFNRPRDQPTLGGNRRKWQCWSELAGADDTRPP